MRKELGGVVGTLRAVFPRLIACIGCAGIAFGFALVPAANAAIVTNGDFATGDFTGWTVFTTANGSLGSFGSGLPAVTSFNVTGSGAQNAATFQVGEVVPTFMQAGGGIMQTVTLPGGSISFSANIAAAASVPNVEGGVFSVLLDGLTEDTVDIGAIGADEVIRNTLSFTTTESAGPYILEILVTRPAANPLRTPEQFVTNIAITGAAAVPEPASLGLLAAGLLSFAIARRRPAKEPSAKASCSYRLTVCPVPADKGSYHLIAQSRLVSGLQR